MDKPFKTFYIGKDFGFFIGPLSTNKSHSHYAFQISLSLSKPLILTYGKNIEIEAAAVFINSKVTHRLFSEDVQLTILINPLSPIGHKLHLEYGHVDLAISWVELFMPIENLFVKYCTMKISYEDFIKQLMQIFIEFKAVELEATLINKDQRIIQALDYLDQNFDRVVTLKEIASLCSLSETRFLHLFKEKTNLNFRRFHLWNRLIMSMPYLRKLSITEAAHKFGFTDSAHYSRTFTETFGLSPKFLLGKE